MVVAAVLALVSTTFLSVVTVVATFAGATFGFSSVYLAVEVAVLYFLHSTKNFSYSSLAALVLVDLDFFSFKYTFFLLSLSGVINL